MGFGRSVRVLAGGACWLVCDMPPGCASYVEGTKAIRPSWLEAKERCQIRVLPVVNLRTTKGKRPVAERRLRGVVTTHVPTRAGAVHVSSSTARGHLNSGEWP